jgi:hypothetical protein
MALAEATEKFRDSIRRAGLAPARAQCGIGRDKPRGFRLSKEKQSLKIDGAVALSFAVIAAEQCAEDIDLGFTDDIKVLTNWPLDWQRSSNMSKDENDSAIYNYASRCV